MSNGHTDLAAIFALIPSFERSLLAENKSPRTVRRYTYSAKAFARHLGEMGMPLGVGTIRTEHVESFVSDLPATWKTATANTYYRSLQAFFGRCVTEGEVKEFPIARIKPPKVPEDAS